MISELIKEIVYDACLEVSTPNPTLVASSPDFSSVTYTFQFGRILDWFTLTHVFTSLTYTASSGGGGNVRVNPNHTKLTAAVARAHSRVRILRMNYSGHVLMASRFNTLADSTVELIACRDNGTANFAALASFTFPGGTRVLDTNYIFGNTT